MLVLGITIQAFIIAIIYLILIIIGLIASFKNHAYVSGIISAIFALLFTALLVYDTNCLTSGNCNVWSIVRTVLYLILPIIVLVIMFIGLFQKTPSTSETIDSSEKK